MSVKMRLTKGSAQRTDSPLRLMVRPMFKPHVSLPGLKESVLNGIAISANRDFFLQVGEVEDAGILQEEVALLGEEQAEAVEIDLPFVDVGLAEITVDREGPSQGWQDAVVRIETRRVLGVVAVFDAIVDSA